VCVCGWMVCYVGGGGGGLCIRGREEGERKAERLGRRQGHEFGFAPRPLIGPTGARARGIGDERLMHLPHAKRRRGFDRGRACRKPPTSGETSMEARQERWVLERRSRRRGPLAPSLGRAPFKAANSPTTRRAQRPPQPAHSCIVTAQRRRKAARVRVPVAASLRSARAPSAAPVSAVSGRAVRAKAGRERKRARAPTRPPPSPNHQPQADATALGRRRASGHSSGSITARPLCCERAREKTRAARGD